jgi:hypothetical protein
MSDGAPASFFVTDVAAPVDPFFDESFELSESEPQADGPTDSAATATIAARVLPRLKRGTLDDAPMASTPLQIRGALELPAKRARSDTGAV